MYEQIVLTLTMLLGGNTTDEIFTAAQEIVMFETELAKVFRVHTMVVEQLHIKGNLAEHIRFSAYYHRRLLKYISALDQITIR